MSRLDSQVFIVDADPWIACHEERYPIDVFPGLWDCISDAAGNEMIRTPRQAMRETGDGSKGVSAWIRIRRPTILLQETIAVARRMNEVVLKFPTLTHGVEESADPWLVAHAMGTSGAVVVTEEGRGLGRGGRPKLPDVCAAFGVTSINALKMLRRLGLKLK